MLAQEAESSVGAGQLRGASGWQLAAAGSFGEARVAAQALLCVCVSWCVLVCVTQPPTLTSEVYLSAELSCMLNSSSAAALRCSLSGCIAAS